MRQFYNMKNETYLSGFFWRCEIFCNINLNMLKACTLYCSLLSPAPHRSIFKANFAGSRRLTEPGRI